MNKKKRDDESQVVFDNQFHRNLTGVRNSAVQQNHPDINAMVMEHHQAARGALAHSTLYSMPSAASRSDEQRQDFERSVQFDDQAPSVFNFRYAARQLEKETKRALKFNRPLTIAIVGFHELPLVYSKYGVLAQEQSIRYLGDSFAGFVDLDIDIVSRYESYRFLLVLPEHPPDKAVKRFEEMRQHFATVPVQYHQYKFMLEGSFGIVSVPHHGKDWKELLAKADLAADMVIEAGGNSLGSC